jgi:hypothetical protein
VQIEILLQTVTSPDQTLTESIFKIMYATEDDFEVPEGEEPAVGAGEEAAPIAAPLAATTGNAHEGDGKEAGGVVTASDPYDEENAMPMDA